MHDLAVIIPIYKPTLSEMERLSLEQTLKVCGSRRIVALTPRSLDFTTYSRAYPALERQSFNDRFFVSIAGYNRLMMCPEFYERFADCNYILICQTDAWLFRDDLDRWMKKGYDYVGAPWPVRPVYNKFHMRLLKGAKHLWHRLTGTPSPQDTDWKVGNGGLSLRKVDTHLKATQTLAATIEKYLSHTGKAMYNEDVFFSLEVNRHGCAFRYPDWQEALQFSFDKYPALCWQLNGEKLPMGCHSWYKKRMYQFWEPVIIEGRQPDVKKVRRADR